MATIESPPNKQAVEAALTKYGIDFVEGQSEIEGGWVLEILEIIGGKALDDVVKLVDTQQNIEILVQPNIGMTIGTEGAVSVGE